MTVPQISVVVPTRDRPVRLVRLLAGLDAQTLAADRFEVVVVDDASVEPADGVLERHRAGHARREPAVRVIRAEQPLGPARSRNRGWRAARAPLVAFTDDDCVPSAGWLEALLHAAAENPGAIVQGRTEPDPTEVADGSRLLARSLCVEAAGPQYETANILYPRERLVALDGFDESYGHHPAGEDTDLALRVLEHGGHAVFAPDALVHHAVHRLTPLGGLRDAVRWGACAQLVARHPQSRGMLHRRVFWNVWHFLLLRSLIALPGPPWLRRVVLRRHLDALRHRARSLDATPAAIPYLVLLDAVETAAVVRGAIRHRTLLV